VFFRVWFARDPLSAAKFACQMLRDGSAYIGNLAVAVSGWVGYNQFLKKYFGPILATSA
jgi:hypothetical protein